MNLYISKQICSWHIVWG